MGLQRIQINPKILRWVIERRGLDVNEYCKTDEKYDAWLKGEQSPTFSQAEKFAKSNYIPMGYLFLQEPIVESMPIPFFRSTKKKIIDLNVMDAVKILQERQNWLSEYLQSEKMGGLDFVGSVRTSMNIASVANYMHSLLDLSPDWAFALPTVENAIKMLTERIENIGCVITFSSTVGFSNKRNIDVNDCRGFCLVNKDVPFIFVNSKDAKQAQLFTLAHEFAHILLGYSAGTGTVEDLEISAKEIYCDNLAALFLTPADLFTEMWIKIGENIEKLVKKFKVSRWVVARRAKDLGLMTEERYWCLIGEWKENPVPEKKATTGKVDFAIRAVRNNGRLFLIHVNNALNSQKILYREAYRLTGIKGDTFTNVMKSKYFLGV
jgi:Zn-dependent peptidase ImmA (M78 family)